MLNLNLLPPQEKIAVAYAVRSRAVLAVGGALAAVLAVSVVLLLPSLFRVVAQKLELARAVELEAGRQEQSDINRALGDIQAINHRAEVLLRQGRDEEKLSLLLADVIRAVPATVRVERLSVHPGSKKLAITGFVGTRAGLLAFIGALERSPRVSMVSSPVANLIRAADIDFSLTITIK